jgi:hypothetical protein
MKKIYLALLIFAIAFSGCSQKKQESETLKVRKFKKISKAELIMSFDFTKYSEKGFLITPSHYGSNYETLGLFTFIIYPEAEAFEYDSLFGKKDIVWETKKIDSQEILDFAYKTALKKGANAITHFKIRNVLKTVNDGVENVYIQGLEVEGLLIKRK